MPLTKLTEELFNLSKNNSNGELILYNQTDVWSLHIFCGKLLYTTDQLHPMRRWDRNLKQHCSKWNWGIEFSQLSDNQSWECQLLERGINQKQLSLILAKLVIRSVVQECLFELSSYTDFKCDWKSSQKDRSPLFKITALSFVEMQTVLSNVIKMHQQWQDAGLGHLSPTLAPVLKQGADFQELPVLDKYLNGQFTLWDIALQLEKSVIEVTSSLNPWVEKDILKFQKIPDLPLSPVKQPVTETHSLLETQLTHSSQKQPLIACIDDSPILAHTLRKILMPAGYQMLSIPEPMRGFSQLIDHKPDLILLDLLLPNADGYSICKFLRETPVFKKTPIIILTAKNTQVDRFRAQEVGATEFLGKPPKPQELLEMIQKYLRQENHLKSVYED